MKRTGGILAFSLAVLISAAGYWYGWMKPTEAPQGLAAVPKTDISTIRQDADRDGLADWEETLWRTSPNNGDSDGDGAEDGREIADGRDPTKPGPDDALTEPAPEPEKEQEAYAYQFDETLGETLTDKAGRNMMANFLEAESRGAYTPETGTLIAGNIADALTNVEIYRDLTINDIETSASGETNLLTYGNLVEKAIALALRPGSELKEALIISTAVQTGNFKNLERDLLPYIAGYGNARDLLLRISVPERFAALHLMAAQDLDTVSRSLETMATIGSRDPLLVLQELARYQLAMSEISEIYGRGVRLIAGNFAE